MKQVPRTLMTSVKAKMKPRRKKSREMRTWQLLIHSQIISRQSVRGLQEFLNERNEKINENNEKFAFVLNSS